MQYPEVMDEEAKRAIAEALAGDPAEGMDPIADEWDPPSPSLPTAAPDDVARALTQNLTARNPPEPEPEPASVPPAQNAPKPRARQSAAGHVDPGLAFMAAFSQNPVLQKMVEESRNRPRVEAEFQRQGAQDKRAQEKWEQERDLMAPLRAEGKRNENAISAGKAEGAQPGTAYSKSVRQSLSEQLMTHASRLAAAGLPGADQVHRLAQTIASNENLSADAAERMAKGVPGMTDKMIKDARAAAGQAETHRVNDAKISHWGQEDKNAAARIDAMRARARAPRESARVRAANVKMQEKLDDEVEKAEWARNILLDVADLKKSVNTGPLAGRIQNAAQMVDLAPSEFNKLKSRLSMVSNRIIKELSGSAVTGNEWQRMQDELANIMNDDGNFESKLADMIELTESIKQRAINRYARGGGNAPINPTNTAERTTAGTPRVRPGETPPPNATPAPKPTAGGDPKTSAAKAWLQANPNDPRAEKVRQRLRSMGAL